jgi:hypothetical protein
MNPWAVRDAAEWEQNQAGISSARRSGLRESFARPETAQFTFSARTSRLDSYLRQQFGGFFGVIGDNDACAGASDA